ncbi:AAA family ATPase [Rufibacter sp. XAAS-G3-1]|uniref:AAA family ATPase n=1 Tax=Rufibacter sp. XAAS-G3-1 TaxID=2729134 RepID=UPI0015E71655|nr:AAA family ATPase [Rufibacter sp. XAAS-G3-1]
MFDPSERITVDIPEDFDLNEAFGDTPPPSYTFEKPNLLETLEPHRFHSYNSIPRPDAIISVDGNILSTAGNITTIAGQAKAGKSGVVAAILAGALAIPGDTPPDTLGITVKRNDEGKALIHIDSEQSRYDHHRSMMQAIKRTPRKTETDWFYSFNLQLFDVKDRRQKLLQLCEVLSEKHGGIYMIILDGGADFVNDTNELKESNDVVQEFTALAVNYNCPLINVLHFNPGISEKGRGHFGSQLERKSESVIAITKDQDSGISTIEGKRLRNSGNLPPIQFEYDTDLGYHVFIGIKKKVSKEETKEAGLSDLVFQLFPIGTETYTTAELQAQIMEVETVKERTALTRIKNLKDCGLIERDPALNKYTYTNKP